MKTIDRRLLNIFLVCTILVLYFGSLTVLNLTDPDEVFYSMTVQEMIEHNSFLTPFIFDQPQFEKPPLFYWGLMASFKMFGVHTFTARLVPVMCGLFGLLTTFLFCRRVFSERIAYFVTPMLSASVLYLGMSKAVLTDIMLSVLITAGFYAFYLWFREAKNIYLYCFAVAAALAMLTKGPIAIVILLLACVIFLAAVKDFKRLKSFFVHPWVLVFLLLSVPWYVFIMAKYGRVFFDEFFIHDNWDRILIAEHKNLDRWYFYPMMMSIGLFPWTFYLIVMGRGWRKYAQECLFFADLDRGHLCGLSARTFETCQLYLACDAGFGDIAGHFDQRTFETRSEAQCFGCHLRDLRVWHHGGAVRSGQPFS